jgi:hypothetical protein
LPPMMTASRVDGTGEGVVDTSLFLLTHRRAGGFIVRASSRPVWAATRSDRDGAQDSQYLILSVS